MRGWNRSLSKLHAIAANSVVRYGLASVFPRAVAAIGMLILTPIGLERLGVTSFAYWLLATYVSGLVVSPDLGIGNGVVNEFGSAHARGTALGTQAVRIRSLIKLLTVVALGWLACGIGIAYWYSMSSDQSNGGLPVFVALALGLFCFLSAVPASLVQRLQLAHEKASRAVLWEGVGKTIGLGLALAVLDSAPNLYLLIVAYMLPVAICSWVNAVLFLRAQGIPIIGTTPKMVDAIRENRGTFSVGKWFLVMQICYLLISALDPYLINTFGSPEELVYFNVVKRPFDLLPMVVSTYALALWPVFRRISNTNPTRSRRLLLAVTLGSAGVVSLGGAVIGLGRVPIYEYLSGGRIAPGLVDLSCFLLLAASAATALILSNYLNAVGRVRIQSWIYGGGALLMIGAKAVSLLVGDVHTFILASALSYSLLIAIPLLVLCFRSDRAALSGITPKHMEAAASSTSSSSD